MHPLNTPIHTFTGCNLKNISRHGLGLTVDVLDQKHGCILTLIRSSSDSDVFLYLFVHPMKQVVLGLLISYREWVD